VGGPALYRGALEGGRVPFGDNGGGKGVQSTMKKILLLAIVLAAFQPGSLEASAQRADKPASASGSPQTGREAPRLSEEQRLWVGRAYRHEKHGWVYLHVEGQPRERGFQHGYLLAKEISESLHATKAAWEYDSAMDWPWLVAKAKTILRPTVDAENLAEIEGIAEGLRAAGAPVSPDELIAYNGIIELAAYWWPKEKEKLQKDAASPSKQACSAFIATGSMTADRGIVLGHNTMGGYAESACNVILDIRPAKGHRILMQAVPGWIHSGTDFFITDAGLVGAETTIGGFKGFDEKGTAEFVRMRRATQDASNIDEWCAIMKKGNNGGYANAWLLGDINTDEIARLELGLKHLRLERKKDGYFVGSNVAEDLKILRFETSGQETDIRRSSVARRVRWKQLMAQHAGEINLERAKAMEEDHFDSYLRTIHPGARSLCGHADLESLAYGTDIPFAPTGTLDAKVVDTRMAKRMSFAARWGSACGAAFDAPKFLAAHPQFDWMRGILKSRPSMPWTEFRAGERQ